MQAELKLNRALRGEEGRFIWLFDIGGLDADATPSFSVKHVVGHRNDIRTVLRRDQEGRPAQVSVDLPIVCLSFTLVMSTGKGRDVECPVGMRRVSEERGLYYKRICNAAADEAYSEWFEMFRVSPAQLRFQRERDTAQGPLMSIITPVYKTPPAFLDALLSSISAQTYGKWEHILVNASPEDVQTSARLQSAARLDSRVRVVDLEGNRGIAENTNAGIREARGDYLCFLDHDDLIEPDTLFEYARVIEEHPDADLIYCDEDHVDSNGEGHRIPLFKPSANIDLLYSNCYVLHLLCVSRRIIDATERSSSRHDGAQDYDLILKAFERTHAIYHVPKVLYHWRLHDESMSQNVGSKPYAQEASCIAIREHLKRRGLAATVEQGDIPSSFRTVFAARGGMRVSTVVSGVRDPLQQLLLEAYGNASSEDDVVLVEPGDLEVSDTGFQDVIAGYFQRPEVGLVMPRLLQPDGLLLAMGMSITRDGRLVPLMCDLPAWDGGYIDLARRPRDVRAAAPACFAMRAGDIRPCLEGMPAYSGAAYAVADICLQLQGRERLCVFTPFAVATLADGRADGWNEHEGDRELFLARWEDSLADGDPCTSPNIDPESPWFSIC